MAEKLASWIITYRDGSTFSDLDGPPQKAPTLGVVCIAIADISCGHYVIAGTNYYCWHYEDSIPMWVPHDDDGATQYQIFCKADKVNPIVLHGYYMSQRDYARLREAAHRDKRLPPMTAKPPPGYFEE